VNTRDTQTGWITLAVFLPMLAWSLPVSPAAADIFTLDASVIDAGSLLTIGNSCSRLRASIGQPAPGYSQGGTFSLVSGFQAIASASNADTLFFDGFEGCKP
jgi:hypothetical protein